MFSVILDARLATLAGATVAQAADTVPIKRASPDAFRPSIVRDAVEAADWMAKSLSG
jgi:hypothetical protein